MTTRPHIKARDGSDERAERGLVAGSILRRRTKTLYSVDEWKSEKSGRVADIPPASATPESVSL